MEFELPKMNVSFEYDEEKDEIVFAINGVEKRVKTEDMITDMEKLQEQNTALEQEPCEDCISRQAVLDVIEELKKIHFDRVIVLNKVCERVLELPPVTPQEPKTGHWIEKDGFDGDTYYNCSECGESWTTIEGTPWNNGMKYCPNCGVKMESEG